MSKRKNKKRQKFSRASAGGLPVETVEVDPADTEDPSLLAAIRQEPLALGIAVFIFFRPWVDGITYLSFNLYYLWFLIGLAALWGARQLMRGETIRGAVPISLLLLFLLIALLTGFDTVQVDKTYRYMLFWSGHALLFFLCINCLRTRAATGLVLGAFVATSLANAAFALFQLEFMLPLMREAAQDPATRIRFFGTSELTAEMKNRLEVNRAFGTHLFPNALAAYLVMTLGCTVGLLKPALAAWRQAPGAPSGGGPTPTSVGLIVWLASILAATAILAKTIMVLIYSLSDTQFMILGGAAVIIAPLLVATLSALATQKRGYPWLRSRAVLCTLALALFCELFALWLSFSRGGMLALAGTAVFCAILYAWASNFRGSSKSGPALAKSAAVAMALLIAALSLAGEAGFAQDPGGSGASPPPAAAEPPPGEPAIGKVSVSAGDLANTASFKIRITYWKVGLSIIRDNFWTGVGLGNFGTVYPKHQYLGAGDVQAAHNDYLQFFAETGVFGFLAFGLFWGYFGLWGARRIVRERDKDERWLLCGIYGGALAFLVHALVEFNFYNPSLAAVEFFVAGLFFARARAGDSSRAGDEGKSWKRQAAALPVLILVALLMGTSTRVFIVDLARTSDGTLARMWNIGENLTTQQRVRVRDHFLKTIPDEMAKGKPLTPIGFASAWSFLPDIAAMRGFGTIRAPGGGSSYVPVPLNQPVPPDAVLFITDGEKARETAMEWCELWIEDMEFTDTFYPYIPEHAQSLYDWYSVLHENAIDPEDRRRYARAMEGWALEGVKRSPEQSWYHRWLGMAYLMRGRTERGETELNYYRLAVQEFRVVRDLYSISDLGWNQLAVMLLHAADAYRRSAQAHMEAGRTAQAQRMVAERNKLVAEAEAALLESARLGNGGVLPDPLPESIANLIGKQP